MKTTMEMPDTLFRKAKAIAALRGQSLKELVTTAITREVGESSSRPTASIEEWLKEYQGLGRRIETAWKGGKSAVQTLHEMRR